MLQSVAFLKDRNHTEQNYEEQPLLQKKKKHPILVIEFLK